MGEQIVLKVAVSGDASNLPEPALPPLSGLSAYSSGRSQSVSMVNGKVSSSVDYNYILVPKSPGQHTIGEVTLHHNGQVFKTNPITIEVVQGQTAQPQQPSQQGQPAQTQKPGEDRDIFIETAVDKKNVYVGEQVTLSFKFYQGVRLFSQPQYVPPDTSGFWAEDLPPQQQYYADIGGRRYVVTEIKTALFPTAPGKYTIGSAQLKCSVEDFSPDGFFNDDFFRGFFSGGKTKVLTASPIALTVLPLPEENKPSDFTGSVGNYQIEAKLDKKEAKVNDPVTLEITIYGAGNIKTIKEPDLKELKGFKKYETLSSLNISKQNYKVQGSKSFKTVLIPQVSGKQAIPSITYSYFDPYAKVYKKNSTAPVTLNVLPGPKEEPKMVVAEGEGVKLIGTDIRYLKQANLDLSRHRKKPLYKHPVFITAQLLPLICFLFTWVYSFRTEKLASDLKYARFTRAYKTARKGLKQTLKLIQPEKAKQFHDSLAVVFTEYIADKLNLSAAGLTLNALVETLKTRGIETAMIDKIKELWQEYDFARFAPSSHRDKTHMENIYKNTEELISRIEKEI